MTKQLSGPALLSSQARFAVIPGLTRDPVPRDSWIADQVRNDKTAKRPCFAVIPGLTRDPVPRDSWIADVETPDPGSSPGQALIRGRNDKTGDYEWLSGPGDRPAPGGGQHNNTKDNAVIGKAGKAVRRDVAQQPADAQPGAQERHHQTDSKQRHIGQ